MICYAIKDWDALYETSETRKLRSLRWVPTPNKHDGKSFRMIMAHPRGMEIFAAWVLILQVASRCPKRGILADADGPLDPIFLAAKTGGRADAFELAFEYLSSRRVGWITISDVQGEIPSGKPIPADLGSKTGDRVSGFYETADPGKKRDNLLENTSNLLESQHFECGIESEREIEIQQQQRAPVREATAKTTPIPIKAATPEPERDILARELVDALMPAHPKPGNRAQSVSVVERILAQAVDPQSVCEATRRNHAGWCEYWRSQPHGAFRPMLHRWFQDGDYMHPPARAETSPIQVRRSKADELIAKAMEKAEKEDLEYAERARRHAPG